MNELLVNKQKYKNSEQKHNHGNENTLQEKPLRCISKGEIEEGLRRLKDIPPLMLIVWKNQYCENSHPSKSTLHSHCSPS